MAVFDTVMRAGGERGVDGTRGLMGIKDGRVTKIGRVPQTAAAERALDANGVSSRQDLLIFVVITTRKSTGVHIVLYRVGMV
jgi:hypothetical protein